MVNVAKGIEEATLMTLTDILEEELPVPMWPSFRTEPCRRGEPGASDHLCAGARTRKTAEKIQNLFMSPVFRVYISPDILGIEIGGALKNVIALARESQTDLGMATTPRQPSLPGAWRRSAGLAWPWAESWKPLPALPGSET